MELRCVPKPENNRDQKESTIASAAGCIVSERALCSKRKIRFDVEKPKDRRQLALEAARRINDPLREAGNLEEDLLNMGTIPGDPSGDMPPLGSPESILAATGIPLGLDEL